MGAEYEAVLGSKIMCFQGTVQEADAFGEVLFVVKLFLISRY